MKKVLKGVLLGLFVCCLTTAGFCADGKEVKAAAVKEVKIEAAVKTMKPFEYLCHELTGPYLNLPKFEAAFLDEFKKAGVKATGPEVTIYWNSPFFVKPEALKWDIGFCVDDKQGNHGKMVAKKYPYTKVAVATHKGSFATTYVTINALYKWITAEKLKLIGGPCMERYLDEDPDKVADAEKRTEIWIPVQ